MDANIPFTTNPFMKKFLSVVLIVFFIMTRWRCAADTIEKGEWGMVTNNAQLMTSINGGTNQINASETFFVSILVKNVSTNEVLSADYSYFEDRNLSFKVISPLGKDISPSFPDVTVFGGSGDCGTFTVPPGQTHELKFCLSNLCKFERAGVYKVTAKLLLHTYPKEKDFIAVSNQLNLEVTKKKEPSR